MPRIPVIDQAAMIVPSPSGPSVRGTTSVQRSVIVHVISWPAAITVTLRPTPLASPAWEPLGTLMASLLKESRGRVEDVAERLFRARPDLACGHAGDYRERRDVAGHDRSRADDGASADPHSCQDRRPRSDEGVIVDLDRPARDAELGVVDRVVRRQDRDFGRDADVLADAQRAAGVQAAVAVDPRVSSDHEAVAPELARAVEPHVAAEVNDGSAAKADPEHAAVPRVAEVEARNVADNVVRQVVQRADHEQLEPPGLLSGLELRRRGSALGPDAVHGDAQRSTTLHAPTLARLFGNGTARSGRSRKIKLPGGLAQAEERPDHERDAVVEEPLVGGALEDVRDDERGRQCSDHRELPVVRAGEAAGPDDRDADHAPEGDPAQDAHPHEDVEDPVVRDVLDQRVDGADVLDREHVVDRHAEATAERLALADVDLEVGVLLDAVEI